MIATARPSAASSAAGSATSSGGAAADHRAGGFAGASAIASLNLPTPGYRLNRAGRLRRTARPVGLALLTTTFTDFRERGKALPLRRHRRQPGEPGTAAAHLTPTRHAPVDMDLVFAAVATAGAAPWASNDKAADRDPLHIPGFSWVTKLLLLVTARTPQPPPSNPFTITSPGPRRPAGPASPSCSSSGAHRCRGLWTKWNRTSRSMPAMPFAEDGLFGWSTNYLAGEYRSWACEDRLRLRPWRCGRRGVELGARGPRSVPGDRARPGC